ncbi:type IV pilus secretin PilQ [Thermodesulfobacteriota bacterium]
MNIASMKLSKNNIIVCCLIILLGFFMLGHPSMASSQKKDIDNADESRLTTGITASALAETDIDGSGKADVSANPVSNSNANVASLANTADAIPDGETPTATRLKSVYALRLDKGVKIKLMADGKINNYQKFTAENPARIIFDIFNVDQDFKKEQLVPVNSEYVKNVRYYGHPEKLRVVLDTKPVYLASYSALPVKNGLLIQVGDQSVIRKTSTSKTQLVAKAESPNKENLTVTKPAEKPIILAQVSKTDNTKTNQPAWVNRIDFSSEAEGKSTIIIGTTQPVKYTIKKIAENRLQLKLMNTRLPDYRKRPLITTRFESAIDRILPFEAPAHKDASLFAIEMREAVPYFVEQADNLIMVHFEASTRPPQPLAATKLPDWKKVVKETAIVAPEMPEAKKPEEMVIHGETKVYTGEKIALDFYETDIKNVFRILREVSKKNFAIDKGVSGKVTLTLETPVPWDQVLDLILKMNGLGMSVEGDIIRIAKKATLDKEDAARKKKAADKKKLIKAEKKEEKALEPMVTEYISINYASATSEVLPMVKPILTPKRGTITVDDRNNQLIITDVKAVIQQAKEIVLKIDQVTPQVLIEARIVEATNSFTRAVGVNWAIAGGPNENLSNRLGGDLTYAMNATNPPTSSLGSFGINFSRIVGTPFDIINATISASETQGDLNIISAPKILTLNNKAATITQGVRYPYNKLVDGETRTEFIDVNLQLEVTPLVTPDDRINMQLFVSNNEIGAVINNAQSFTTKEARTELLVNDGETVVIGGIRKTTKRNDVSGVPVFKDMPVIGWLFKSKGITDNKEELLIFITPKIVKLKQRNF